MSAAETRSANDVANTASTGAPVFVGYLTKLGRIRKTWKRRLFKLRSNGMLEYYRVDKGEKMVGRFSLDECTGVLAGAEANIRWDQAANLNFCFFINLRARRLYAYADSAGDLDQWLTALAQAVPEGVPVTTRPEIHAAWLERGYDVPETAGPDDKEPDRVTVFENGKEIGGKVIFMPATLQELNDEAAKVLGVQYLSRVFNANGGEIKDISLVRDDDILYLSEGGDFIPTIAARRHAQRRDSDADSTSSEELDEALAKLGIGDDEAAGYIVPEASPEDGGYMDPASDGQANADADYLQAVDDLDTVYADPTPGQDETETYDNVVMGGASSSDYAQPPKFGQKSSGLSAEDTQAGYLDLKQEATDTGYMDLRQEGGSSTDGGYVDPLPEKDGGYMRPLPSMSQPRRRATGVKPQPNDSVSGTSAGEDEHVDKMANEDPYQDPSPRRVHAAKAVGPAAVEEEPAYADPNSDPNQPAYDEQVGASSAVIEDDDNDGYAQPQPRSSVKSKPATSSSDAGYFVPEDAVGMGSGSERPSASDDAQYIVTESDSQGPEYQELDELTRIAQQHPVNPEYAIPPSQKAGDGGVATSWEEVADKRPEASSAENSGDRVVTALYDEQLAASDAVYAMPLKSAAVTDGASADSGQDDKATAATRSDLPDYATPSRPEGVVGTEGDAGYFVPNPTSAQGNYLVTGKDAEPAQYAAVAGGSGDTHVDGNGSGTGAPGTYMEVNDGTGDGVPSDYQVPTPAGQSPGDDQQQADEDSHGPVLASYIDVASLKDQGADSEEPDKAQPSS